MAAIQLDTSSLMVGDLLPEMLKELPEYERHHEVRKLLSNWTGEMSRKRPEPLIFAAWMRELNRAVYADELGDSWKSFWGYRPRFIMSVLSRKSIWCDDIATPQTEDCGSQLAKSLDGALQSLKEQYGSDWASWRWGTPHKARFSHLLFGRFPLFRNLANLETETDGGYYTVNRGANILNHPEHPFSHVHGAGLRAVYDLSDLSRSRFIVATGQSGNPLSKYYRNFLEKWRDGGLVNLGASRPSLQRNPVGRLILSPQVPG
jgi:penicillin amidase